MSDKFISTPLVSVIVATYRREDTLKRALLSLVSQTYPQIEVIVVDDNADKDWNYQVESILEHVKSRLNNNLIYIKNKENKGSAETRNIGINKASGTYITFLDDDDIYLPNKIEKQVEYMLNSKSDYSLTDLYLYDEKGYLIEKRNRNYIKDLSKKSLIRYHLMYHMTGTDVMMFKKDYLLRIGGFSHINVGDEFYLMQKAIEADGKFGYLPVCDVKAYVHTHTDGLSSGETKVKGENELYNYKKNFFNTLSSGDKRFIIMRHYAVLAFAELRRKKYHRLMFYALRSICASPVNFIGLIINRR